MRDKWIHCKTVLQSDVSTTVIIFSYYCEINCFHFENNTFLMYKRVEKERHFSIVLLSFHFGRFE